MHEHAVAMTLIDAICEKLPRLDGVTVRRVHVRVGPGSGVTPGDLTSAFDEAVVESPIDGAELAIEQTAGNELELTSLDLSDQ